MNVGGTVNFKTHKLYNMYSCTECHNCGAIWSPGTEEYDWQKCSACGWSPGEPIDEDDDEDFYEETVDYTDLPLKTPRK